jgi:hypothetical protein
MLTPPLHKSVALFQLPAGWFLLIQLLHKPSHPGSPDMQGWTHRLLATTATPLKPHNGIIKVRKQGYAGPISYFYIFVAALNSFALASKPSPQFIPPASGMHVLYAKTRSVNDIEWTCSHTPDRAKVALINENNMIILQATVTTSCLSPIVQRKRPEQW